MLWAIQILWPPPAFSVISDRTALYDEAVRGSKHPGSANCFFIVTDIKDECSKDNLVRKVPSDFVFNSVLQSKIV